MQKAYTFRVTARTRLFLILGLLAAGASAFFIGKFVSAMRTPAFAGIEVEARPLVNDHQLVLHTGQDVAVKDVFTSDVNLIFFGFTRCPDVCPFTMARLGTIYEDLDEPSNLNVVMITVDPGHDTPEVLGAYVRAFNEHFVGLTGPNSAIAGIARDFFVGYGGIDANITHTEAVAVVDKHGRLRYIYANDKVASLASDLPGLLKQL